MKRISTILTSLCLCAVPFALSAMADDPLKEIIIQQPEDEDPFEESLDLIVYLNPTTGIISVETFANQWIWVFIMDAQTGAIYSVDVIDPSYNYGEIYHTYAPSTAGEYCILFRSDDAEAIGYFSII